MFDVLLLSIIRHNFILLAVVNGNRGPDNIRMNSAAADASK